MRMLRRCLLALHGLGLAVAQVQAQTTSHDPGTEFGQANRLMGLPFWIIVGVIVAAAALYTFGSRRGRPRE